MESAVCRVAGPAQYSEQAHWGQTCTRQRLGGNWICLKRNCASLTGVVVRLTSSASLLASAESLSRVGVWAVSVGQ